MPPDGAVPGSPQDWLRHAASDLAVAMQSPAPGVLLETLCYHAQQAAEKSIKAVLVASKVGFPYTHNIARLITIVQDAGLPWPTGLDEAAELTEYAVQLRYPGVPRQVTEADLKRAAQIAKRVFDWAESLMV